LSRALVVAAGKSGETLETDCLLRFFAAQKPAALCVVTDAGSALHKTALNSDFARVFLNPPAVGGRFAPLTWMGLLPAALLGMDVDALLAAARAAMNAARRAPLRKAMASVVRAARAAVGGIWAPRTSASYV